MSAPGKAARVSVQVAVEASVAFEVFTREIDLWWRQGPAYRVGGRAPGQLTFEPGLGGRLFETYPVGGELRTFEVGRVTAWDPPSLLAFEWKARNFAPNETTLVEVRFIPQGEGTLVSLVHSGWSTIPDDHPVRHGLVGPDFSRMLGFWWGGLMMSLRQHVQARIRG